MSAALAELTAYLATHYDALSRAAFDDAYSDKLRDFGAQFGREMSLAQRLDVLQSLAKEHFAAGFVEHAPASAQDVHTLQAPEDIGGDGDKELFGHRDKALFGDDVGPVG